MRSFKPRYFFICLLFTLPLLLTLESKGQYYCDSVKFDYPFIPLPKMFVEKRSAGDRETQFTRGAFLSASKSRRISREFSFSKDSFNYSKKTFSELLMLIETTANYERLRIYFGAYAENNCSMDFGLNPDELVLIFSAEDKNGYPVGKYYIINPVRDLLYEISNDCKESWTNNFAKVIFSLNKTIRKYKSDPNNYIEENGKKYFSDTRSIAYRRDSIHEAFVTEIDYQLKQHKTDIIYFKANFASYTKAGRTLRNGVITNKKRLILQFEFLYLSPRGTLQKLDQEKQMDYKCRKAIAIETANQVSVNALPPAAAADNGQLCPANCPK